MYMEWVEEYEKAVNKDKCEYCTEDFDGYYKPLDKNAHICIFDTPHKKYIDINWYGHKMQIDINFCPMCGRRLKGGKK